MQDNIPRAVQNVFATEVKFDVRRAGAVVIERFAGIVVLVRRSEVAVERSGEANGVADDRLGCSRAIEINRIVRRSGDFIDINIPLVLDQRAAIDRNERWQCHPSGGVSGPHALIHLVARFVEPDAITGLGRHQGILIAVPDLLHVGGRNRWGGCDGWIRIHIRLQRPDRIGNFNGLLAREPNREIDTWCIEVRSVRGGQRSIDLD